MPHVNYQRGESSRFVFRREHGNRTHATYYKGKGDSNRYWKQYINRFHRHRNKEVLHHDIEDPFDKQRHVKSLSWIAN